MYTKRGLRMTATLAWPIAVYFLVKEFHHWKIKNYQTTNDDKERIIVSEREKKMTFLEDNKAEHLYLSQSFDWGFNK